MPVVHFVIDQFIETPACISIKATGNFGDQFRFGAVHRFGGHSLHHTDTRNDDKATTHFIQEPVEQYPPVGSAFRFFDQPCHDFRTKRFAKVTKSKSSLDPGKLIVTGRIAASEVGNDVRLHAYLLGDVVEHDRR